MAEDLVHEIMLTLTMLALSDSRATYLLTLYNCQINSIRPRTKRRSYHPPRHFRKRGKVPHEFGDKSIETLITTIPFIVHTFEIVCGLGIYYENE